MIKRGQQGASEKGRALPGLSVCVGVTQESPKTNASVFMF